MKIVESLKNMWGRLGEVDCPEEADAVAVLPKELIESLGRVDEMAGKFTTSNNSKGGKSGKGIVDKVVITPELTLAQANIARKNAKQSVSKGNDEKQIGE